MAFILVNVNNNHFHVLLCEIGSFAIHAKLDFKIAVCNTKCHTKYDKM